jgi:hypothetical protein
MTGAANTVTPWYRKVYKGAKAQYMWQGAAGLSIFIAAVIAPIWYDYCIKVIKSKKSEIIPTAVIHSKSSLQQQVYEKRLQYREMLKNPELENTSKSFSEK